MPVQSYADALVDALYDSLAADHRVSLIGSYVLGLGPQRHLMDRVRKDFHDRIVDPPTAEAGAAATGVGAAMAGVRPFVDLGTGSFSYLAWSQIVNEAAISCYMSEGRISVPVTFHLLHGVRGGGAAQHSQSPQSMMCNAPGSKSPSPRLPLTCMVSFVLPSRARTRPSSSATPSCSASKLRCRRTRSRFPSAARTSSAEAAMSRSSRTR